MTDKTGGPAFPIHGTIGEVTYDGMTLRDYAAIKAMAAHISCDAYKYGNDAGGIARQAYIVADAMIAERSKGE